MPDRQRPGATYVAAHSWRGSPVPDHQPRSERPGARTTTVRIGAFTAAVVLVALTMRGPIVALSSVLDQIVADLGIGPTTAGLLTSVPVLCFGLSSPLVSLALGRLGLSRGVLAALGVLGAGMVLRSAGGIGWALAGTAVIGVAITAMNIAVPVLIGHHAGRRSETVLGVYTGGLNVGSMIMLSATVPIAEVAGWRIAVAAWAVLVGLAAVVWWRTTSSLPLDRPPGATRMTGAPASPWWRRPIAWLLTAAFAGQAFAYYGLTAWLPTVLRDRLGLSAVLAGPASSIFQISAVAGAFGIPVLLRRARQATAIVLTVACWAAMPVGLLLAPAGWVAWSALGGAGQGAGLTVVLALAVRSAYDVADSRRLSAAVQGGGYLVAATGPSALGAAHQASGGWTAPLLVVCAALVVLLMCGLAATRRPRQPRRPGTGRVR